MSAGRKFTTGTRASRDMDEVKKVSGENLEKLKGEVTKAFLNSRPGKRHWALMMFFTEMELGISNTPNKWVNVRNIYYDNGIAALNAYAEAKCPASQLVDGETEEELLISMENMIQHYTDDKWLEENLYPYM